MTLRVATCQFPVTADIRRNLSYISRQLREARRREARVAHFPEAGLSGYAGVNFASHDGFDWALLDECTRAVLDLAGELGIWVLLGSAHRLTAGHKPHNSLYIVDDQGKLVDRYDKMFCAGSSSADDGDLAHYSSGNHFSVFTIDDVRCGALICHDSRYPELYREYKRQGVQLVFHSFNAGGLGSQRFAAMRDYVGEALHGINPGSTLPGITQPATMIAAAAANHLWISAPNSSARESCWASFFVRADGVVTGRVRLHTAGVLVSEVDPDGELYDGAAAWRDRAMAGTFHSGPLVRDPRSDDRLAL
jgi:predicted amidohydrolase